MTFVSVPTKSNGDTIDASCVNLLRTAGIELEDKYNISKADMAFTLSVNGYYGPQNAKTNILTLLVPQDLELLTCKLKIFTAGSGGNTEIDVYSKRGAGAWASIFTTKPKIPSTAGDYADSDTGTGATAAALNSLKTLLEKGDMLRLDFTSTQDGDPKDLAVEFGYQITGA